MNANLFYRSCLALPFIVPAILWASLTAISQTGVQIPTALNTVVFLSAAGIMAFLIPYSVMALTLVWWLRTKDVQFIRKFFFFLPLLFAAIVMALGLVYEIRLWGVSSLARTSTYSQLMAIPILCLPVGYAYVVLTYVLAAALERAGWIQSDANV